MFQGGEPLLAGIDFFRSFISTVNSLKDEKTTVNYSLQTNGTLIDDEFCRFFKENNFLIGVSLDGDEATHNAHRCDSFEKVIQGIGLLKKHGVDFNIISVITSKTDAAKLFEFYMKNDFRDVQPIYCLDPLNGEKAHSALMQKALRDSRKVFQSLVCRDFKGRQILRQRL